MSSESFNRIILSIYLIYYSVY